MVRKNHEGRVLEHGSLHSRRFDSARGLAAGYLLWTTLEIATYPRVIDPKLGRFEATRREEVRRASWTYRTFEPLIDELVARRVRGRPEPLERIQRDLTAAGEKALGCRPNVWPSRRSSRSWPRARSAPPRGTSREFPRGWSSASSRSSCISATRSAGFASAARRRRKIKRSLAGAIDLLALMIEVGGSFQESLGTVAKRLAGTPLGDELSRVISDIAAGTLQKEALRAFADRTGDEDVAELVFAVVQGQELGTPMSSILRNQAEQMRQKRSQWAEKAAEEAQVTIMFPAMLIMLACLLIVAAPFIINTMMQ